MSYESPADAAKSIRATLKADYGYTSRQVSVRSSSGSISLEIKDPSVNYSVVEAVAERKQKIDYCKYSGEILSGGNLFVSVRYSHEAEAALSAPYIAPLQAAMDKLEPGSSVLEPVVEGVLVGITSVGNYQVWTDRAGMHFSHAQHGAFTVALRVEAAKAAPKAGDFKALALAS